MVLADTMASTLNGAEAALSTVVLGLITWGGRALIAWLKHKAEAAGHAKLAAAAETAVNLATDAAKVGATAAFQSFTQPIKAGQGATPPAQRGLTDDQKAEAKQRALDAAKAALGAAGRELVQKGLGDLDAALAPRIEAAYAQIRPNGGVAK